MEEKKSYFAIIPTLILFDDELLHKPKTILLYGHISTLANKTGECWATNKYFAEVLQTSTRTVSDYISLLKNKGYIKIRTTYRKGTKQIEKRFLFPTNPIEAHFHSIEAGCDTPIEAGCDTPIETHFQDNNTSKNNTSKNNTSKNNNYNNSIDINNNIDTNKNELSGCGCVFEFFEKNVGMLSPFLREDIQYEYSDWLELNKKEAGAILIKAMEIAVAAQAKQKWRYAKAILKSWKERNIHTLNAIELDNEENSKSRKATKPKDTNRKYHF